MVGSQLRGIRELIAEMLQPPGDETVGDVDQTHLNPTHTHPYPYPTKNHEIMAYTEKMNNQRED